MTKFLDKIIVMRFTFKKILNLLVVSYLTRENDVILISFGYVILKISVEKK